MDRFIVTGHGLIMDVTSGRLFTFERVITVRKMPLALSQFLAEHQYELRILEEFEDERQVLLQEQGEIFSGRPAHLMFDAFSGRLAS